MALDRVADVKKPSKDKGVTYQDLMQTDKATWEYVTIPETNVLDEVHPNITINSEVFETGKTYLVPHLIAETLNERIRVYARSCVRILSPKKDHVAENAVAIGSTSANRIGAVPVADASQLSA